MSFLFMTLRNGLSCPYLSGTELCNGRFTARLTRFSTSDIFQPRMVAGLAAVRTEL